MKLKNKLYLFSSVASISAVVAPLSIVASSHHETHQEPKVLSSKIVETKTDINGDVLGQKNSKTLTNQWLMVGMLAFGIITCLSLTIYIVKTSKYRNKKSRKNKKDKNGE